MTKSPTRPIDTSTNTRLYFKKLDKRNNPPIDNTMISNNNAQNKFEKRSRSNLPYSKKPTTTRSDLSEVIGDVTTAATASPSFRHALSIGCSEIVQNKALEEVSELPQSTFLHKRMYGNSYRKSRLLTKGCPKLLKLVEKH